MKSIKQDIRRRLAGFTIVEIVIVVVVVAILIGSSLAIYNRLVIKSEDTESVINLRAISKAEETLLLEEGTYVNATDVEDIEEELEVALQDKIFTYRVEEATEESYVAIAERREPIEGEPLAVALGPTGPPMYYYEAGDYDSYVSGAPWQGPGVLLPSAGSGSVGASGSSGSSVSSAGSSTGSSSSGSSGSSGSGSEGSSGSSSGDSSGDSSGSGSGGSSSGSGGSSGGSSDSDSPIDDDDGDSSIGGLEICGNGSCAGTESCATCEADCGECVGGAVVDAALMDVYNALKGSTSGGALGTLLDTYNVTVALGDAESYGAIAYWSPSENKIVVGSSYFTSWTAGAITAVLAHEANHAYFTYDPDYWISETLTRHPELTTADLHIDQTDILQYPWNSIDQEYNSFKKEAEVWTELKDATNSELDYVSWLLAQGEETAKPTIRTAYAGQGLPEY
ncbi:hypothetical protein ACFL2J_04475 [Candidatus Omnitrophota bacterium]